MSAPKITVATITRNNLPELRATVESVLAQDANYFELIIIDGASNDGTVDFLKGLSSMQVRWISEPDRGIADAFNKAHLLANGTWIIFMNAGDTFVSADTLKNSWDLFPETAQREDVVAYGDYLATDDSGEYFHETNHLLLNHTNSINHQSAFVGRNIYQAMNYDLRLILGMDYDFWLRCSSAGVPFVKLPLTVARFRLGGRSSGLDFRVHNSLMRYFLRALNSQKILGLAELWQMVKTGLSVAMGVSLRRCVSPSKRKSLKRLLRR